MRPEPSLDPAGSLCWWGGYGRWLGGCIHICKSEALKRRAFTASVPQERGWVLILFWKAPAKLGLVHPRGPQGHIWACACQHCPAVTAGTGESTHMLLRYILCFSSRIKQRFPLIPICSEGYLWISELVLWHIASHKFPRIPPDHSIKYLHMLLTVRIRNDFQIAWTLAITKITQKWVSWRFS